MYRKGVSALILNSKKEFLLVNLESFKEEFFAIPGGGIEEGESLEDAIYREVQEELGIDRKHLEFIGKSTSPLKFKFKTIKMTREGKSYEGSERYFFGFIFNGNDDDMGPRIGEVRSYKWVSYSNLKDYLLFDNQLQDTLSKISEIFPDF